MKKIEKTRLKIGAETVRSLGERELGVVAAGYPTFTQIASGCTVGTYNCGCTCECQY